MLFFKAIILMNIRFKSASRTIIETVGRFGMNFRLASSFSIELSFLFISFPDRYFFQTCSRGGFSSIQEDSN